MRNFVTVVCGGEHNVVCSSFSSLAQCSWRHRADTHDTTMTAPLRVVGHICLLLFASLFPFTFPPRTFGVTQTPASHNLDTCAQQLLLQTNFFHHSIHSSGISDEKESMNTSWSELWCRPSLSDLQSKIALILLKFHWENSHQQQHLYFNLFVIKFQQSTDTGQLKFVHNVP